MSNTVVQSGQEPKSPSFSSRDKTDPVRIIATSRKARRSPSPGKQAVHSIHAPKPLSHVAKLSPPVGQFVINTLLQTAAFVAAIAFGIYAVKSVDVGSDANKYADTANRYANVANQLAVLDLCLSTDNQNGSIASICSRVIRHAETMLPSIASTLFPDLPTLTPSPTPTSSSEPTAPNSGSGHASSGALIGIIVGSVLGGLVIITIFVCVFRWRRRRRGATSIQEHMSIQEPMSMPESRVRIDQPESRTQEKASPWAKFREVFIDSRVVTETH